MRQSIILAAFLLLAMQAFSQEEVIRTASIVSSEDSVECEGQIFTTLWYDVIQEVTSNGTTSPDTTWSKTLIKNGKCPADSTFIAEQMEAAAVNSQQEITYHIQQSLQRGIYSKIFRDISSSYTSFTGASLETKLSGKFYSGYDKIYRVFKADATNFFAVIVKLPNGSLRLREVVSPNDLTEVAPVNQYVFQPRTEASFRLLNFEGATRDFTFGASVGDKKIYLPSGKIANLTGAMRIVEIAQKP